jgi:hypothetical protein
VDFFTGGVLRAKLEQNNPALDGEVYMIVRFAFFTKYIIPFSDSKGSYLAL